MMRKILALVIFAIVIFALGLAQPAAAADKARPFMSLSYSPSGIDVEAQLEQGISPRHIVIDLVAMQALTGHFRTYTVDRGLDQVLPAARRLGFKVSLGLWLGPDKTKNEAEIARGLRAIINNGDVIERVYVGNETLQRQELTAAELAEYIGRVKSAISSRPIAVSTAEAWHEWLTHPELASVCDFVGVHILPYWDGVPVTEAVTYLARRYTEIETAFPKKPIVIAETGWPSNGPAVKGAVASLEAQTAFTKAFLEQAKRAGYDYNFIEAYDQPYKGKGIEGAVGAHWGLLDARHEAKFPLTPPASGVSSAR